MDDTPNLADDAWARIELVKLKAAKKLSRELVEVRAEKLRRYLAEKFVHGTDDELLFQVELGFAFADYIKEAFLVEVEEQHKTGLGGAKLRAVIDPIIQAQVLSALPMWAAAGGKAEYRDSFIETAYKVVKVSRRYEELLEEIGANKQESTAGKPSAQAANVEILQGKRGMLEKGHTEHGQGLDSITAQAGETSAVPRTFPERAAWLKSEMQNRDHLTPYALHKAGGPDSKTVKGILEGKPVRDRPLELIANALSLRGPKVLLKDIPTA
jgi:hypothetical protein